MIEVILIISLSIIFIILLRKLPEVNINNNLSSSISMNSVPVAAVTASKFIPGEEIEKLWKKANLEFDNKNFNQAEKFYLKIAAIDPKNTKIYEKLGVIYLEQKNFIDAKEAFLEATRLDSKNALWFNNLGLSLYNLNRFSESIKAYRKSLALDNSKAIRFFNLGLAYEAVGKFKKALNSYKRAAAIEPENQEFLDLVLRIEKEIKKTRSR